MFLQLTSQTFFTLFTSYSILLCIVAQENRPHHNFPRNEQKNQLDVKVHSLIAV